MARWMIRQAYQCAARYLRNAIILLSLYCRSEFQSED